MKELETVDLYEACSTAVKREASECCAAAGDQGGAAAAEVHWLQLRGRARPHTAAGHGHCQSLRGWSDGGKWAGGYYLRPANVNL